MSLTELGCMKKKMNTRPSMKIFDLEDIQFNELNKYEIKDIEELKENISQYGLLKPLEVYMLEDEKCMLIGGHRRLKALLELFNEGMIEAEVPCMVYQKPEETEENIHERLQIIISNGQRDMSIEEKVKVTKELLDILKASPTEKAPRMPTRDWIAGFLGCSPRSAQKYLNDALGKVGSKKGSDNKELSTDQEKESNRDLNKLVKLLETYNEKINVMYWSLSEADKKKTVAMTKGEDVTIEKMLTKLTSITDLYVKSLNELER